MGILARETSDSPLQPDVSTVDKAARKIDRNSGILSDRSLFWSIFMHPFSSARLHRLIQLGFVLFLSWSRGGSMSMPKGYPETAHSFPAPPPRKPSSP